MEENINIKKLSNLIVQNSNSGISGIKLSDPNTYNSLSLTTLKSLIETFKSFNDDDKTTVIIIEGLGKGSSVGGYFPWCLEP